MAASERTWHLIGGPLDGIDVCGTPNPRGELYAVRPEKVMPTTSSEALDVQEQMPATLIYRVDRQRGTAFYHDVQVSG